MEMWLFIPVYRYWHTATMKHHTFAFFSLSWSKKATCFLRYLVSKRVV